jgi:DNA phosphorothioation-dependent restriction protein DptG
MATLTIKNIPENLIEQLRNRATHERRSLNQEVIHLLEQILISSETSGQIRAAAQRQVEAWQKIAGRWKSALTPEEEIHQIYSARTTGRDVKL